MKVTRSDQELFNVFELAGEKSKDVLLLRIGGPLEFRQLLVSNLDAMELQQNKVTNVLLDQRIPSISVLIADPDGVPFLTRLDYEQSGTWGIWRVRHEILSFANGLCKLSNHRQKLKIGFHRGELFWSLGIVCQTAVLVRSYGSGTGHDDLIESEWLQIGEKNFLAESFIKYWKTIARRADTKWMRSDFININNNEPKWPGLYKGNAVLSKRDDQDQEDFENSIPEEYVLKICRYESHQEGELAFVSLTDEQREPLSYFRPVKMAHFDGAVPYFMEQPPVVMEKLIGFSLFEIANQISIICQSKETQINAYRVLAEILLDTIDALKEFRQLTVSVIPERKKYQYGNQLASALREVKHIIGPHSIPFFDDAIKEVESLGSDLVSKAKYPFRDAHLKNRIWVTDDPTLETLVNRLLKIDPFNLKLEIKNKVKDIDFETSGFDVTEWDDVIHILFFEKSGIFSFKRSDTEQFIPSVNLIESYNNWCCWGKVHDETGFWMTVLARSIREFCRRLWYTRTMPNTYNRRYGNERIDYFLDLALYALEQLSTLQQPVKYENIMELLAGVKKSPEIWSTIPLNQCLEVEKPRPINLCETFVFGQKHE